MSIIQTTALLASLAASVFAHGYVSGIVADGTYYEGYSPSFQYSSSAPTVAGWSNPENLSNGFVAPDAYADPDIVCHLSATPGGTAAKVAAGGTVELQWTTWPESHHGPVLDYLAPVSGAWADIDKTNLEFVKINQGGLIDGSASPGKWASDDLIANNNTWSVTIPTGIATGKYVLRHEIIALHSAGEENGAQNYPQCVNLEITGGGSDSLSGGTAATSFYKADDPGVLINIYQTLDSYTIPGPALYKGAASPSQTGAASSSAAAVTTTASAVVSATGTAHPSYGTGMSMPYGNSSAPAPTASPTRSSAAETTAYTTVDQTATAYATVTATAASSSDESVAPAAPSSTAPATPTGDGVWGEKPSKPLPSGYTLKDLEMWVAYLTKPSWSEGAHARDLKRFAGRKM